MSSFDMIGHRQVAFFMPAFPRISHRERGFQLMIFILSIRKPLSIVLI